MKVTLDKAVKSKDYVYINRIHDKLEQVYFCKNNIPEEI